MLESIRDKHLLPFRHGFFTRQNGVSGGKYKDVNKEYISENSPDHIENIGDKMSDNKKEGNTASF